MRLINTNTLAIEEFFEEKIKSYAILSHRWTDQESTFKEYSKRWRTLRIAQERSPGLQKVVDFCNFARARDHEWIWIDTVCIDKRNSAELSEAINSMFAWYAKAEQCYAYLIDVDAECEPDELLNLVVDSVWFKRGWTLQELLASKQVVFLARDWRSIGRKRDDENLSERLPLSIRKLQDGISEKTGIPVEVLKDSNRISRYSVAQRMSWAAKRQLTRPEDEAYCLLGLFGVNMSLLYGEGKRAFVRLQLEIIKDSHDETIFAWQRDFTPPTADEASPLLAESANDFEKCRSVSQGPPRIRMPWLVTNHGLQIPVPPGNTIEFMKFPRGDPITFSQEPLFILPIDLICFDQKADEKVLCYLYLVKMRCGHLGRICTGSLNDELWRTRSWTIENVESHSSSRASVFAHLSICEDLARDVDKSFPKSIWTEAPGIRRATSNNYDAMDIDPPSHSEKYPTVDLRRKLLSSRTFTPSFDDYN